MSSQSSSRCPHKVSMIPSDVLLWLKERHRIIIVVHDNPDPDCLASAMGLRQLFLHNIRKDALITFSGIIGRSENLALAKAMKIILTPWDLVEVSSNDAVCMLDTQPQTGNNSVPPDVRVDLLIDHHPLRSENSQCRWIDVRSNIGATATIVYEYLVAHQVPLGPKLATALFYAIKSETQDLGREASHHDREAYLELFPLANKKLLFDITHPKLPIEYFLTINKALNLSTIYQTVVAVTRLEEIAFPEIVAEMADFVLQLEGVEVVLCLGRYNKEILLSLRTIRSDINSGEVIRKVVAGLGTAGGHGMMAGGKVDIDSSGEAAGALEELLTQRLLEEVGIADATGLPLIP